MSLPRVGMRCKMYGVGLTSRTLVVAASARELFVGRSSDVLPSAFNSYVPARASEVGITRRAADRPFAFDCHVAGRLRAELATAVDRPCTFDRHVFDRFRTEFATAKHG